MAGCSMAEVTTWGTRMSRARRACSTADAMAWLSLSDPHDVKTISDGSHPSMRATCARAVSTAFLHGAAKAWPLEGLPKCSQRKGSIAAATSGKMGVVAL